MVVKIHLHFKLFYFDVRQKLRIKRRNISYFVFVYFQKPTHPLYNIGIDGVMNAMQYYKAMEVPTPAGTDAQSSTT